MQCVPIACCLFKTCVRSFLIGLSHLAVQLSSLCASTLIASALLSLTGCMGRICHAMCVAFGSALCRPCSFAQQRNQPHSLCVAMYGFSRFAILLNEFSGSIDVFWGHVLIQILPRFQTGTHNTENMLRTFNLCCVEPGV